MYRHWTLQFYYILYRLVIKLSKDPFVIRFMIQERRAARMIHIAYSKLNKLGVLIKTIIYGAQC